MTASAYLPAGTIKLATVPSDVYEALPGAGVQFVTKDSEMTLADLTVTDDVVVQGDLTAADALVQGYLRTGVTTGITAFAGGGQADATQLTETNNFISVCATAGDSVKLPVAVAGMSIFIRNDGAKNAQVFGTDPATINGVATGTGVTLNAASSAVYRASSTTTWVT